MSNKVFKIVERKQDAVLLYKASTGMYKVRDIENDDIYIGYNEAKAYEEFKKYSLEETRKAKNEVFEEWLKEFAEE